MKSKPKRNRAKYRNLHARNGVIYYERVWNGKRIKLSAKTDDWDEAAAFRDLYEEAELIRPVRLAHGEMPMFAEFAKRYLEEDAGHLAPTTLADRKRHLSKSTVLMQTLGETRVDDITADLLTDYWRAHVEGKGRSPKTGRNHLDTVAAVLAYARERGLVGDEDPVQQFRQRLRRKNRTQRARAQQQGRIRPVEDPESLVSLIRASEAEGAIAHLLVLTLLDAGLRLGEALALQWRHVHWGKGPEDRRRWLVIEGSRSRGAAEVGPTKSGRDRRVGLSQRLWLALRQSYLSRFKPGRDAFVLPVPYPTNFRRREWRRILDRAGLAGVRMKDLRDTYACHLLTAGVQLGYVSQQLGHADVAVTAHHYARWIEMDAYTDPVRLEAAELPADVLARIADSHHTPTTAVQWSDATLVRETGIHLDSAGL